MKFYFAAGEPHNMKSTKVLLLSYYDLEVQQGIPFRKETFNIIKNADKPRRTRKGTSIS